MSLVDFDGRVTTSHALIHDRTDPIERRFFFMRDVKNLSSSFSIERTQHNGKHLHPSISSEPLIEDEEPNPTSTPKYVYKYTCSLTK